MDMRTDDRHIEHLQYMASMRRMADAISLEKLDQTPQRVMLNRYEEQLLNARRLAKFKVKQRMAQGLEGAALFDPDPAPMRGEFVKKVAQELYDSMIFTGGSNAVFEEIRQELSQKLGKQVQFTYPPGGRLRIVVQEADGMRPLTKKEQLAAKDALWPITRRSVNKNMTAKPLGTHAEI